MRAVTAGKVAEIRNPDSIRPWQHVLEPLSGYLLLAEKLFDQERDFAEAWNFGPAPDDAKPVSWLADRLCQLWGKNARWENANPGDAPHEASLLNLDCSKANTRLGWQPRLGLDDALAWTVEWYQCFAEGGNVLATTAAQIDRFESRQVKAG